MMRPALLAIALTAAGASGVAVADALPATPSATPAPQAAGRPVPPATHRLFTRLDANHDGVIDRQEAKRMPSLYRQYRGAKLDEAQFAAWEAARHKPRTAPAH